MTKPSTSTMFALAATLMLAPSVMFSTPAAAADAGAVLSACDRTTNCSYRPDKDGNILGCSEVVCFICPADGKHECHQARTNGQTPIKAPVGGVIQSPGDTAAQKGKGGINPVPVGGVMQPPGGAMPPKGKGGITPVQVAGVKETGSGGQPVTIFARGAGGGGGFGGLQKGRR
jgi:hypothetical protein